MIASPVDCTIDLEAVGRQPEQLRLRRSNNASGWSSLCLPIGCVANGVVYAIATADQSHNVVGAREASLPELV